MTRSSLQNSLNFYDYKTEGQEIEERLQKSYKVCQKIKFEMTETNHKMKQMKDIMEKGADSGYGENTQDGFDAGGVLKQPGAQSEG